MRIPLHSLRARILFIVFVALVPAWALLLHSVSVQRRMIESDVLRESLRVAELAASSEEGVIEGARQLLTALHVFFRSFPNGGASCQQFLNQLLVQFQRYTNLGGVDREGSVLCSALPMGSDQNVFWTDWFQSALHTNQFIVGDFQAGRSGKKPLLVLASPVLDATGRVDAVVFASIDLRWPNGAYASDQLALIPGSFFALMDEKGVVLSHYPETLDVNFLQEDPVLIASLGQETSQVVLGHDSKGTEYIYALSPVRSSFPARRVHAVIGLPSEIAFAKANRALGTNLLMLVLVSLFVAATLWFLGNRTFLHRLGGLVRASKRLAEGDLKARTGLAHQDDELGRLASTFDDMAGALERREREHEEAEAKIRHSEEQLRRLQTHVQQVREEERLRLAREIHDELGQALTALKFDLVWLRKRMAGVCDWETVQGKVQSMSSIIDLAMGTVHRVSAELRPRILDDLGLGEAIEWQADEFQKRTGIDCTVLVSEPHPELTAEQSTALFRVFQEALTNVARHAEASRVEVSLDVEAEAIVLIVSDDGRGIRPEEIDSPTSYGLLGIRERVYSLNGEVQITGQVDGGTQIKVQIPLTEQENQTG